MSKISAFLSSACTGNCLGKNTISFFVQRVVFVFVVFMALDLYT